MREIRQSGSEGGGGKQIVSPYPYLGAGERRALLRWWDLEARMFAHFSPNSIALVPP